MKTTRPKILIFVGSYLHIPGMMSAISCHPEEKILILSKTGSGFSELLSHLRESLKARVDHKELPEGRMCFPDLGRACFYLLGLLWGKLQGRVPSSVYVFNSRYTFIAFVLLAFFEKSGAKVYFCDLERHLPFTEFFPSLQQRLVRKLLKMTLGADFKVVRNQWWSTIQLTSLSRENFVIHPDAMGSLFHSFFLFPEIGPKANDFLILDLPVETFPGVDFTRSLQRFFSALEVVVADSGGVLYYKNHPFLSSERPEFFRQLRERFPQALEIPSFVPAVNVLSKFSKVITFSSSGFSHYEGQVYSAHRLLEFKTEEAARDYQEYSVSSRFNPKADVRIL